MSENGQPAEWFMDLLRLCVNNRPDAAYCLGCHGDSDLHVMLTHDERGRAHLYGLAYNVAAMAFLDRIRVEVLTRFAVTLEEYRTTEPSRRHLLFEVPG